MISLFPQKTFSSCCSEEVYMQREIVREIVLLEIVNSTHIVSDNFVSNFGSLLVIKPSLINTILHPPYLFLSLLKGGNW